MVLCAATVFIGATLLCASLLGFGLDERVRAWPTTTGRLLDVQIGNDTIGASGRYANVPMRERRFHVSYAYAVAGRSYLGGRIGARAAEAHVSGRRDRYVVGQIVTVHYNSTDPGQTAIEAVAQQTPWRTSDLMATTA